MATATYAHISLNTDGVPVVSGTRTKVVEIAVEHLAYGWDANELHRQHPYLSLGQIHSALAYYYDHQAAMEADIHQRRFSAERISSELDQLQGEPPLLRKLRATDRLP